LRLVEEMEVAGKGKVGRPRKIWKVTLKRDLEVLEWMKMWHLIKEDGGISSQVKSDPYLRENIMDIQRKCSMMMIAQLSQLYNYYIMY